MSSDFTECPWKIFAIAATLSVASRTESVHWATFLAPEYGLSLFLNSIYLVYIYITLKPYMSRILTDSVQICVGAYTDLSVGVFQRMKLITHFENRYTIVLWQF